MLTSLIKEHQRLVAHVAQLEKKLEEERAAALAALPTEYGYPDVASFIRALRQAAAPKRKAADRKTRRALSQKTEPAKIIPPAQALPAAKPSTQTSTNPPQVAMAPQPAGTSLDDPANFGLLPDISLLAQGSLSFPIYQSRLSEALRFAQKVLHTSRVPAKVWREWRQFDRDATEALRANEGSIYSGNG